MAGKAILFSEMSPSASGEDEFNNWYDKEHIPPRMLAPGFLSAQRYRNIDGPAYLALYEMEDKSALATPEYLQIKASTGESSRRIMSGVKDFTRYVGEEMSSWRRSDTHHASSHDAELICAEFVAVPAAFAREFERWNEKDHDAALLQCPDWLAVRRFRIVDAAPHPFTHLALHYLASLEALQSNTLQQARKSPVWKMLARERGFTAHEAVFRSFGQRYVVEANARPRMRSK